MNKRLKITSLLATALFVVTGSAQAQLFDPWQVELTATGLPYDQFVFGAKDGATLGYDENFEDPLPPALPSGALGGFHVNGAPFPELTVQDYRPLNTSAGVFMFVYAMAAGSEGVMNWEGDQGAAPLAQIVVKDAKGSNLLGGQNTMATVKQVPLRPSRDGMGVLFFVYGDVEPVANDDVAQVLLGKTVSIDVLANDFLPAPGVLLIVDDYAGMEFDTTKGGKAQLLDNQFSYTPSTEIPVGETLPYQDTFTYQVEANGIESVPATVAIWVNGNVAVKPRDDMEPGKPGEIISVTVDVECAPLAGLAFEVILPRTQEDPPTLWTFDSASYSDNSRAEGIAIPGGNIYDSGTGAIIIEFPTLPTSLTLNIKAADAKTASTPLLFARAAENAASMETAPFPDRLPEVRVPMKFGNLDVDMNGQVNTNDLIYILRWVVLPSSRGKVNLLVPANFPSPGVTAQEIADNIDGLGGDLDTDGNGQVNTNDLIYILRWVVLPSTRGKVDLLVPANFPSPGISASEISQNIDNIKP